MDSRLLPAAGLVFGIGFGFFVQRAGLCFAHGLGEIFVGRGKRIARMFVVIFAITAAGFLISGYLNPQLGLKPIGQIRGYGFFNVVSGILFGAGIFINGGCILGTLRQLGEGNMTFLIVLLSFIPGMALVVYGIDPLLAGNYDIKSALIPGMLSLPQWVVTGVLVSAALICYYAALRRKKSAKS